MISILKENYHFFNAKFSIPQQLWCSYWGNIINACLGSLKSVLTLSLHFPRSEDVWIFHIVTVNYFPRCAVFHVFPHRVDFLISTYWQLPFSTYRCSPEETPVESYEAKIKVVAPQRKKPPLKNSKTVKKCGKSVKSANRKGPSPKFQLISRPNFNRESLFFPSAPFFRQTNI